MILLISLLFLIPFPFLYLFFPFIPLSFLSTVLYNLYLNPNLLKILSNYTYTIPKVTTLHTYILTSCLIFFTHFHFSFFSFISIFLHISTFPYSFSYSPSYISISFTFPLCISILLSYFSYTLSCYALLCILYLVIINFIGFLYELL